jgi:hypothetical protein
MATTMSGEAASYFARYSFIVGDVSAGPSDVEPDVAAVTPTKPSKRIDKCRESALPFLVALLKAQYHSRPPHRLCMHNERPGSCRHTTQRNKAPPPHTAPPRNALPHYRMRAVLCITANLAADVRFGSKADMGLPLIDVRFSPQKQTSFSTVAMSALCQFRNAMLVGKFCTHRNARSQRAFARYKRGLFRRSRRVD